MKRQYNNMQQKLYIRLPINLGESLQWWWNRADGSSLDSGTLPTLEHLINLTEEMRAAPAIIWIPAEQGILENVDFIGTSRLSPKQLACLLVDKLGQPVTDYHWWLLDKKTRLLFGCPYYWLNAVLPSLSKSGINVERLIPEVMALPDTPVALTRAGGRWLLRFSHGVGCWLHDNWVNDILPNWCEISEITLFGEPPFPGGNWGQQKPECGEQLLMRCSRVSPIDLSPGLPRSLSFRRKLDASYYAIGLLSVSLLIVIFGSYLRILSLQQIQQEDEKQLAQLYYQLRPKDALSGNEIYTHLRRINKSFLQQYGPVNFFDMFSRYRQLSRHWQSPQLRKVVFDSFTKKMMVQVLLKDNDLILLLSTVPVGLKIQHIPASTGLELVTLTFGDNT